MPADLTAAEIIALLRERPGCCGRLSIHMELANIEPVTDARVAITGGRVTLYGDDDRFDTAVFREWLTGACVEKCEELGIDVVRANSSGSEWYFGPRNRCIESDVQLYPTFLHAATAAIEAHCKENGNG